ncbi:MAG: hypothetical protein KTR32_36470 [Granulosicoccus sp.]|nr:hypothetical protein [Granulosicoccus sp.]
MPLLLLFHWWFQGNWILSGIYLGLSLLAILSVPLAYHLFGYAVEDDARWLKEREAIEYAEMHTLLENTRKDLVALKIDEGVRQADMLNEIIDDYHSVVETRFLGKKHSPMEYLSAARTVQKHALQNLVDVVAVGHSISTIELSRPDKQNQESEEDMGRHEKHQSLHSDQTTRLNANLAENRKLFDALTETAVEVANMRSFSKFERTDTLARLVGLAELASRSGK